MAKSPRPAPQSWSLIIFCYNEAGSVQKVFQDSSRVLSRLAPRKGEIVIVDDGSTDGSREIIRKLEARSPKVRVVYHPRNLGIGRALLSGYTQARYENICAIPADGQFNVRELLPFKTVGEKTFVSFFRKAQEGYGPLRKRISQFNRLLNRTLLKVKMKDVNWVKIYKLKELSALDLRLQSSLVESEICSKLILRGNRMVETLSVYHRRKKGKAKGASLLTLFRAFRETLKLVWIVRNYGNGGKRGPGNRTS